MRGPSRRDSHFGTKHRTDELAKSVYQYNQIHTRRNELEKTEEVIEYIELGRSLERIKRDVIDDALFWYKVCIEEPRIRREERVAKHVGSLPLTEVPVGIDKE